MIRTIKTNQFPLIDGKEERKAVAIVTAIYQAGFSTDEIKILLVNNPMNFFHGNKKDDQG